MFFMLDKGSVDLKVLTMCQHTKFRNSAYSYSPKRNIKIMFFANLAKTPFIRYSPKCILCGSISVQRPAQISYHSEQILFFRGRLFWRSSVIQPLPFYPTQPRLIMMSCFNLNLVQSSIRATTKHLEWITDQLYNSVVLIFSDFFLRTTFFAAQVLWYS